MDLSHPYFHFLQRFQNTKGHLAIIPPEDEQLKKVLDILPIGWYSNQFLLIEPAFYKDIQSLLNPLQMDQYTPFATNAFGDLFLKDNQENVILLQATQCKIETLDNNLHTFLNETLYECDVLKRDLVKEACRKIGYLSSQQLYQFKLPPLMGGQWSVENITINPFLETISQNLKIMHIFRSGPGAFI